MAEILATLKHLNPELAWGIFLMICLIMVVVPYFGMINRAIHILFSEESTVILDFSFRIIPEEYVGKHGISGFYVTNSESPIFYKGMRLLICWNVKGAVRVDLYKKHGLQENDWSIIHKQLTGNTKVIVLDEGLNQYKLVITSPKGKKVEKSISIETALIRKLKTFNISQDIFFGQDKHHVSTKHLAKSKYSGKIFSWLGIKKILEWNFTRLKPNSIRTHSKTKRITFESEKTAYKQKIQSQINQQNVVQSYRFRPSLYNRAISDYQE
jgi:hypothetical protein